GVRDQVESGREVLTAPGPAHAGIPRSPGRGGAKGHGTRPVCPFGERKVRDRLEAQALDVPRPQSRHGDRASVRYAVERASTNRGIGQESPEDEVEAGEDEWHTPKSEEARRLRAQHGRFPENRETAPHETEGDEEDVRASKHDSAPRRPGPQQALARF